jgi:ABC-2 type transport system ATP-binding protein
MIEVNELTKSYGNLIAVDRISFGVGKGEILGFLGPNGSGKTSTMRILTCFMPPTSGKAVVAGYDCFEQPLEVKRRVGYLPESVPLYRELKVIEFLGFVARARGLWGDAKKRKVGEAMELTGLGGVEGKLIDKLSKGFRQRVGIAQALLNDPPVLILDEPTEGLDPKQIVEVRKVIKQLAEGERTVILSTHILPEVSLICDRVVIIHRGRIVAEDRPDNLVAGSQNRGVLEIAVEGKREDAEDCVRAVEGVTDVRFAGSPRPEEVMLVVETEPERDLRPLLSAAIVHKGLGLLEIKKKLLTLEDVFVNLVTEEDTKK